MAPNSINTAGIDLTERASAQLKLNDNDLEGMSKLLGDLQSNELKATLDAAIGT